MVTAAIGRVVFAVVVAVVLGSTWAVRHARVRLRESKQSARSRVRRMR